jgi:hypothetical protein
MGSVIVWLALIFVLFALAVVAREDWFFLTRQPRTVRAIVTGHRRDMDEGGAKFSAVMSFVCDTGEAVEVIDPVRSPDPNPPVGTSVTLVHPEGLPGKARIRRPLLRTAIYVFLVGILTVLVLRMTGRIA